MTTHLTLEPFRIAIPDAELVDLKGRLAAPAGRAVAGHTWQRGVPVDYLRELALLG